MRFILTLMIALPLLASTAWAGTYDGRWQADVVVKNWVDTFKFQEEIEVVDNSFDGGLFGKNGDRHYLRGSIYDHNVTGYFMWSTKESSIKFTRADVDTDKITIHGEGPGRAVDVTLTRVPSTTILGDGETYEGYEDSVDSLKAKLELLQNLLERDLITAEEVATKRAKILGDVGKDLRKSPTKETLDAEAPTIAPEPKAIRAPKNKNAVAVIIGNRNYEGDIPKVDYAHNDADAIRTFVTDLLGHDSDNIIDLRDATKAKIEATFGNERSHKGKLWSYLDAKGGSDVVIYYSGHGVPGQQDQKGYLLPTDADPNHPEINGYPLDLLYANLDKLEARSITVLLDACFSGGSHQGILIRSASPILVTPKEIHGGSGELVVLTAASGDQLASWDEKAKHGMFTRYFLEGAYGAADTDGDRKIELEEIKTYLDQTMTRRARRDFLREQEAWVNGAPDTVLVRLGSQNITFPRLVRPTFEITPLDGQMVAARNASVRSGPGTSHDRLQTLDAGDEVNVTGRTENGEWYRIALASGRVGYVFNNLLEDKRAGSVVGETFRDCPGCPEMVVVPAGEFMMGSPESEKGRQKWEGPVRRVTVRQPFAIGKYEVTFAEWDFCVADGGCNGFRPKDKGWGRGRQPVIFVSYKDIKSFTSWLSRKTGHAYRLPSEAEWEYAARAGTTTRFHFGDSINPSQAKFNGKRGFLFFGRSTRVPDPVGSYPANAFGLHDVHGNLWERVEDCWNRSYAGAPSDTSAWRSGDCHNQVKRGGTVSGGPDSVRSAWRAPLGRSHRHAFLGFRIARTLP